MPILLKHPAPLPRKLPRLAAWWDFSDVSTLTYSSGIVKTVADKSGNGWTADWGSGSSAAPLAQRASVTGKTALDGTSASIYMGSSLSLTAGDFMISYAMYNPARNIGLQRAIQGSTNWLIGPYGGDFSFFNGSGFVANAGTGVPAGQWSIHTAVVSASLNIGAHWGNGVLLGSGASSGVYPGNLGMGTAGAFAEAPHVMMGEVVVLRYYDEPTRKRLEAYLAAKWGTASALPQSIASRPVRRQFFTASAGGATVALTQQAGTGTIGSLATGRTEALAQVAATGNVGTVTAVVGVTAALSQVAGTGTVGTIAPSQAVPLAQQAGTGTVGTLTAGRAATLAQQAGTGTVGTPVESVSVGIAQTSATGNVGTVTAVIGATAALSQVAGTGTVGAVVASTSIGVAQTAAAGTIGSIAPSRTATLAQTAGTGAVGTATPGASIGLVEVAGVGTVGSIAATAGSNVTVSLTQQSATGAVGTVTASVPVTVSLAQVAAAGTIGAMAPSQAVGVTQVAGTGTVGTITAVSGAVTVALSQQAATGTVGSLAWARSLGLGHLIGTGAVGTLTPGGAFVPSARRTLTLTASARTLTLTASARTIIIP